MNRITINLATGRPAVKGRAVALPAFIIFVALMLLWQTGTRAYGLRQEIEKVSRKVTELSAKKRGPVVYKDADAERASLAAAAEIMAQRKFSWIDALDNLEKALPQNVSLTSVQPLFKEGSIKLTGYAKDFAGLSRFIDNLAGLRVYRRVLLVNQSTKAVEGGREAVLFSISIEGEK